MVSLTDLPPEVIHNVLQYIDPSDLAFVPRVCQALHHSVRGNAMLFKHVYLANFDKPARNNVNWEQNLKDLVRLQVVCGRPGVQNKVGLVLQKLHISASFCAYCVKSRIADFHTRDPNWLSFMTLSPKR